MTEFEGNICVSNLSKLFVDSGKETVLWMNECSNVIHSKFHSKSHCFVIRLIHSNGVFSVLPGIPKQIVQHNWTQERDESVLRAWVHITNLRS